MAQPSLGSRTPRQRIKGEVTLCIGGEATSSARAGMCIRSGTQTGERCPPAQLWARGSASCGHGAPLCCLLRPRGKRSAWVQNAGKSVQSLPSVVNRVLREGVLRSVLLTSTGVSWAMVSFGPAVSEAGGRCWKAQKPVFNLFAP